jgi:probable phosphoglycerate mutase
MRVPVAYPQLAFAVPPDAVELLLVRHGASTPAVSGQPFPLVDGHDDPALAPEGLVQADAVAARLAAEPLSGLFVSGLRRTVQTAAPLAQRLGVEPVVVPELREVMLGDWAGGAFRIHARNRDPIAMRVFVEERWDLIPNAEPAVDFTARLRAGIERVVAATPPGTTAAVFVHGGVIGELCRQATASRPFAIVHSDNGSLTRLVRFADGRWLLRSFNEIAHLA